MTLKAGDKSVRVTWEIGAERIRSRLMASPLDHTVIGSMKVPKCHRLLYHGSTHWYSWRNSRAYRTMRRA